MIPTPKNPIKVCLVAPLPPPYGGIANWTHIMEKLTPSATVKLEIVNIAPSRRSTEGRSLFDRIVFGGVAMVRQARKLHLLIDTFKPDAVHITTSGALAIIRDIVLLKLARRNGIPTFYHIRFGRIAKMAQKNTHEWRLISKAMQLATRVIAIDQSTFITVKKYLPNVGIVQIPNLIDLTAMPSPKSTKSKKILYLGWVIKTKGIEELCEAWEKISSANPAWRLEIVGPYDDNYIANLKLTHSVKAITFVGEKSHEESMQILNRSEILILPSYSEGFPNVLLEAMSLKKAIIATKVGAIPEMLQGNCGVLIEPKNSKAITNALTDLIHNPIKRSLLGENAMNKVQNEYSFETVLQKYLKEWRMEAHH